MVKDLIAKRFCGYCSKYHFENQKNFLNKINICETKLINKLRIEVKEKKSMPIADLFSAVSEIINKNIPTRKENAIIELQKLEDLLGRALLENEDNQAALIRKRMKQLRKKFPDIE